jgi:FixJ family two-component response regulator
MRAVLLDDDADLLDSLAELLETFGWASLKAASVEALRALGEAVLSADVAILDVNLGPARPSGLDAFDWLQGNGFAGRIFFLTGHARSHPLVSRAHERGVAVVLEKPLTADALMREVIEGGG